MKLDLYTLFEKCNQALDEGDCALANSFLAQAYTLLLHYPVKHILWAVYYLNLAGINNNRGKFDTSREYCHKADRIISVNGDVKLKAQVESTLASSYLNTGDFSKSMEHSNNAMRLFSKMNLKENIASELISKGKIYFRRGNWQQSIENYSEALFISKKLNNKRLEGRSLMALGYVFRGYRFLYLAIDHYREAERVFQEINFNQGLVMALYERANTYLSLEMPDATSTIMRQIESLTPEDSTMRTFIIKLQYCIHNQNKNGPEAMVCANQLLAFYQNAQDRRGEAESLAMIASSHYNANEMDKAKYFGEEALKIAYEIGDKIIESTCMELLQEVERFNTNNIDQDQIKKGETNDRPRN